MKERLVEDWLIRINERGYQTAFGQWLSAKGFEVLRIGHSPYEHGKDVLAIAPNGEVHSFQLKGGNIGLDDLEMEQLVTLVETRPEHPRLPSNFKYRVTLVTNGLITDPALDRIRVRNIEWKRRKYPKLNTYDGRKLQKEFLGLASDFWPTTPPDLRRFRCLYLAEGKGDFSDGDFSRFLSCQLTGESSVRDFERKAAAVNIFTAYLLAEFYKNSDHWSIIKGWIHTAAAISASAIRQKALTPPVKASIKLARDAAITALFELGLECEGERAFYPVACDWDPYVAARNTIAIGTWAASHLICPGNENRRDICVQKIRKFIDDGRLSFWGEGSLPFFLCIIWLLEHCGYCRDSKHLLVTLLSVVADRQQPDSNIPLPNVYTSTEDALIRELEFATKGAQTQKNAVRSWVLHHLVHLLVSRGCRKELEDFWGKLTKVTISVYHPASPDEYLEWRSRNGKDEDGPGFNHTQSWAEIRDRIANPPIEKLPESLRVDAEFRLLFLLVFHHRVTWSLVGSLDEAFGQFMPENAA